MHWGLLQVYLEAIRGRYLKRSHFHSDLQAVYSYSYPTHPFKRLMLSFKQQRSE